MDNRKLWVEIEIKEPTNSVSNIETLLKAAVEERFENAKVSRVIWGPWFPSSTIPIPRKD